MTSTGAMSQSASRQALSKPALLFLAALVLLAILYMSPAPEARPPVGVPPASADVLTGLTPPAEQTDTAPYIVRFDLPKIAHLRTLFPTFYRETPSLVAL
jgi:hypothetical protein